MRLRWRVLLVGEHYLSGFSAGYLDSLPDPPRGAIASRAYYDGVRSGIATVAAEDRQWIGWKPW